MSSVLPSQTLLQMGLCSPLPFRPTDDSTFFNLRLPQWVIKWQRAKCSASPHPADRRTALRAARVYSIPIGACFKSIFIILHLFFIPIPSLALPRGPGRISAEPSRVPCGFLPGIVAQSRWPSPDIGGSLNPPQNRLEGFQDKFWLIWVFKLRFRVVQLPGTIVRQMAGIYYGVGPTICLICPPRDPANDWPVARSRRRRRRSRFGGQARSCLPSFA